LATSILERTELQEAKRSPVHPKVESYIDGVLTGRVVACKYVRQAVERHLRDLETGKDRGLWFDPKAATVAIRFIEMLQHSKGEWAGKPFELDPHQAFIIWCIFGWKKSDGTRRFNVAFISEARKNGKSTLGAGVGLKLTIADNEPGAEVYSAATKRDQAKIVHNEAKNMVKKSPCLASLVETLRDVLYVHSTESMYRPLGADADTTDGLNVHGAIIDEVHAHKTRALWDVLETSTGSRRNPLLFCITTAGDAGETESIYAELKAWTAKVLGCVLEDDSWFGIIYTLDEGDDWTDERNWIKANPNLGVSVKLDDLRRLAKKAMATPAAQANFRRKRLNQETESSTPWISVDAGSPWDKCNVGRFYGPAGLLPETIEKFRNRPCWVGGDLSSIDDLTALAFAFPDDTGIDLLCLAWCPRENAIGRTRDKRVPYLAWAESGYIQLTEGNSVDYDAIRHAFRKARDEWQWDIRELAFDPANARYLLTKLREEDGFLDNQIVEHGQTTGFMNDPIGAMEKLILDAKLRHGGNPVLRWCVSNCVIYQDTGGRRRFDKKNRREKIDLAVAAAMAIGRAASASMDNRSYFESHSIEFI